MQSVKTIRIDNLGSLHGLDHRDRYLKNLPPNCHCHRNTHHDNNEGNASNKPSRQYKSQTTISQWKEELSEVRRTNGMV